MDTTNLTTMVQQLNPICSRALEQASLACLQYTHATIDLEHWLLALLDSDCDLKLLLQKQHILVPTLIEALRTELERKTKSHCDTPTLSQPVINLLKEAYCQSQLQQSSQPIRSYHLFIAMLESTQISQLLNLIHPAWNSLTSGLIKQNASEWIDFSLTESDTQPITTEEKHQSTALSQYSVNLNVLAAAGKIDRAIGREDEIQKMTDILLRRRQNNPILVGEPGVGKTAVVEGLALKITNQQVPTALLSTVIHALDLGLLMAGTSLKGVFEKRLSDLMTEIKSASYPILLFIDEAHLLVGAGNQAGSLDMANLLKPALARGELKTIAATTWAEYKQYFEKDAALTRRFQMIKMDEPNDKNAIAMCRSAQPALQSHHHINILDEAIVAAVSLSRRYIAERCLPDKALSLLDTACARVALQQQTKPSSLLKLEQQTAILKETIATLKLQSALDPQKSKISALKQELRNSQRALTKITKEWQSQQQLSQQLHAELNTTVPNKQKIGRLRRQWQQLKSPLIHYCVNAAVVRQVVADWTGIPPFRLGNNQYQSLIDLKTELSQSIHGQDSAITSICRKLKQSFIKLNDPTKPLGVFLFCGPSGVGKTYTARCLAQQLFGSTQHMTTINLSEFKEEHKVAMLLGAPAGYVGYGEGGVLTEAVRRQPYHLVLLDEIEKAHPSIHEIFYQIFDHGQAQDGQGRVIDFRNTLFILTSNIGAQRIKSAAPATDSECLRKLQDALCDHFQPAFIGRLDLIPFAALTQTTATTIIQHKLAQIAQRIQEHHDYCHQFSDDDIANILEQSRFELTGAREFDKVISERILPALTDSIIHRQTSKTKVSLL